MAQRTKAQLLSDLTSNFPDNMVGAITAEIFRNFITDILDSYLHDFTVVDITAAETVDSNDEDATFFNCKNTSAINVTFAASTNFHNGYFVIVHRSNALVTISGNGSDTFNGSTDALPINTVGNSIVIMKIADGEFLAIPLERGFMHVLENYLFVSDGAGGVRQASMRETDTQFIATKEIVTTPTSIIFGENGVEISSAGQALNFDGTDGSEAFFILSRYDPTNGSLSFIRSRLVPRASYSVQSSKAENSTMDPSFTYTVSSLAPDGQPDENRRHTEIITLEFADTATITATLRDGGPTGRLMRRQTVDVVADTETAITLDKPLCLDIGTVVHVSIEGGARLKGQTISTVFVPFLNVTSYLGYDDQIATAHTLNDFASEIKTALETLTGTDRLARSAIYQEIVEIDNTAVTSDIYEISASDNGKLLVVTRGTGTQTYIDIPSGIASNVSFFDVFIAGIGTVNVRGKSGEGVTINQESDIRFTEHEGARVTKTPTTDEWGLLFNSMGGSGTPAGASPITEVVTHTATGTQNFGGIVTGKVHVLQSTVTSFDTLGVATFSDDGLFVITNLNSSAIEFDVSASGENFAGHGSGVAFNVPGNSSVLFYVAGAVIYPISDYRAAGSGAMGDHPVVLTRNTPSLADLNTLAQESLNDNSGLWIVASDQDVTFEGTIDPSIMIRSLRSGILDADGASIPTSATQKSGVRLAGGTVVRIFSSTDLRVVSGPLMAAGSRYPDQPTTLIAGQVLNLVGNQVLYNIYRNRTAIIDINTTGFVEVRLPSLQNAVDLAYLNRSDVFCFRHDGTNGEVRVRTFQVGTTFSDGTQTITLNPGQIVCVTPAPSGNVWTILVTGQSTDISTENININTDWYRDGADATAADNSVRLHYRRIIVDGDVRDHIVSSDGDNNPVSLRFQHRNVQDDIAWIQWWSTWNSSVPVLGIILEEILANIPTALTYIENNINAGFDFEFDAPDSVSTVQSISWISGNEVRIRLHSAYVSSSYSVNHPVKIVSANNAVHNGEFLIDAINVVDNQVNIHVTNTGVTDGTADELGGAIASVPVYADVVFVTDDQRVTNFNLYKDSARTSPWTSHNTGWFDHTNTDAASVLAIGYNIDIETTGSQLAVQDDAGDWFSVKGGPRKSIQLLDNRTTYVSSGVYLPVSPDCIQIDTLGVGTFYIPEHPDNLEPGESRQYLVHSLSSNDNNDVTVAVGTIGAPITFDEGFLALDILNGTRHLIELYNDGNQSGCRVISPISKSSSSFPQYQTAVDATTANTDPLPMAVQHIIAQQNEDVNFRFFAFNSPANSINMRANADYVFEASVEVLFNGTEGTGLLFVPVTLMPIINGDDKEEFAHTVSLIFSRNGQSGSTAPKFSHTLRVRFEWQGSVNDQLFYDVRFGTFPAGYSRTDIQVRNWTHSQTAQLNLN